MLEKIVGREADIFGDLPKESWCDITTLMKWHCGALASIVAELLVRTTLPHLHKAQSQQDCDDLGRFEYRDTSHYSGDHDRLYTHELRVEFGLSVFQEHFQHFPQIGIQFVEAGALRMRAREPRNITNEESGLGVTLYHS